MFFPSVQNCCMYDFIMYTYTNIYSSYTYILQMVYNSEAATRGVL